MAKQVYEMLRNQRTGAAFVTTDLLRGRDDLTPFVRTMDTVTKEYWDSDQPEDPTEEPEAQSEAAGDALDAEIVRLRSEGLSFGQIAEQVGVDKATVQRRHRKAVGAPEAASDAG